MQNGGIELTANAKRVVVYTPIAIIIMLLINLYFTLHPCNSKHLCCTSLSSVKCAQSSVYKAPKLVIHN